MTIEEMFEKFAADRDLMFRRFSGTEDGPGQMMIGLEGTNGQFLAFAMGQEEERLFIFYVSLGVTVEEDEEDRMLPVLMELNYRLRIGAFYIDPATRVLTYRLTHYLIGRDEDCEEMMLRLVTNGARIADEYAPGLMEVLQEAAEED